MSMKIVAIIYWQGKRRQCDVKIYQILSDMEVQEFLDGVWLLSEMGVSNITGNSGADVYPK